MRIIKERTYEIDWSYYCTPRASLYTCIRTNNNRWVLCLSGSYTNNNLLYYDYEII